MVACFRPKGCALRGPDGPQWGGPARYEWLTPATQLQLGGRPGAPRLRTRRWAAAWWAPEHRNAAPKVSHGAIDILRTPGPASQASQASLLLGATIAHFVPPPFALDARCSPGALVAEHSSLPTTAMPTLLYN